MLEKFLKNLDKLNIKKSKIILLDEATSSLDNSNQEKIKNVIKELSKTIHKPLIVGGLISDKEDVMEALRSGATCISTTKEDIWKI